ncbi:enoyl-CoA hydratase-related protein [Shouchella clausii]|uniref:enoyl-CoA hydratase-related protein n=1 Tax=Shouchella clausii TaxID=79880 RepID=UPI0026F41CFC|nr:enoyl-CoA hydratase-related protein [Shouchella clausii]MDO7282754.1 enoyl-CoA hydratase-related protein [Shouchella clausii]MDO7302851.1 enoyl-CoA hydratase-related protein [Shouchella clausii]
MSSSKTLVQTAAHDGIARITLNRPQAANALSLALLDELEAACDWVAQEHNIRVVILAGAGEKAFCAGADLKERANMTESEAIYAVKRIGEVIARVEKLPQPVIADVGGSAFGGGLELCLACDVRIFAEDSFYGLTETKLAIIPGAGGTQRLTRLIGPGKAKELIFTARRLTGTEARKYGLCEWALPREKTSAAASQLAVEMASNGPIALQAAKKAINEGAALPLEAALAVEREAYLQTLQTEDRLEGLASFKEKRPPVYKGK